MALKLKLSYVSLDKTARILVLRDTTGVYAASNPTGYGDPNPVDFQKAILNVSHFGSNITKQLVLENTDELITGAPIALDSQVLGITPKGAGLESFSDGVLEINYHMVVDAPFQAWGTAGNTYIEGENLDWLLGYEHLMIEDEIYPINKTLDSNGGYIIHLTKALKVDIWGEVVISIASTNSTSPLVYPVASANLKVLIQANSDQMLVSNIGKMALEHSCSRQVVPLSKVLMWKFAAQVAFDCKDYCKADELLHAVSNYGQSKACSC